VLEDILEKGVLQKNRTGIDTYMIPGAMLKFDLSEGFPLLTTKKMAFKAVVGELLGFLRGYTSAAQFRELGCKIWDQNANENVTWLNNPYRKGEDDLGYIYSKLWRDMPHQYLTQSWDQIDRLIKEIETNPTSRRLIVSAWHPEVFDKAALPPCHYAFQVIIEQQTKKMHLLWNQRSCDYFLGVPFNIASYALLLTLLSSVTGYTPGTLTGFLADVHLYENHLNQANQQLMREPMDLPSLILSDRIVVGLKLEEITPEDIELKGYNSYTALKGEMAV
jgi:thymidylate synthase